MPSVLIVQGGYIVIFYVTYIKLAFRCKIVYYEAHRLVYRGIVCLYNNFCGQLPHDPGYWYSWSASEIDITSTPQAVHLYNLLRTPHPWHFIRFKADKLNNLYKIIFEMQWLTWIYIYWDYLQLVLSMKCPIFYIQFATWTTQQLLYIRVQDNVGCINLHPD